MLVLVKLTYDWGWGLPGGGRDYSESAEDAVLRELREEIGMCSYGILKHVCDVVHSSNYRTAQVSLFVIRHVEYQPPRYSLEIDEVREFQLHSLPSDMSNSARQMLHQALRAE